MTDQVNKNLDQEVDQDELKEQLQNGQLEQIEESDSPQEEGEVKQKARSTGHLTQEEYLAKNGSLKGYKTEEEFVRTGDMIEQIMSLKKMLSKRESEVEAILNYSKSTIEENKKKLRQELDTKLMQAREYGNIEAVEALVKQQTKMEYVEQQENLKQQLGNQQQVVEAFLDRNRHWYNTEHPEAVQRANQIDKELTDYYTRIGKTIPLDDLALQVESQMRREFPDLVNTGIVARPAVTTTKSSVNKASANFAESDDKLYSKLNGEERAMYQAQKRIQSKAGYNYSIKDFVKQIKEDGEL